MTTVTILNLSGLIVGFVSALILLGSADTILNVLAKASRPTVVVYGRGPDSNAISQLAQAVEAGELQWHRKVRIGVTGLFVGFVLQVVALLV